MTWDATAHTLVAQSVLEHRCTEATYRDDLYEDLLALCDDYQDEHAGPGRTTVHFWGTTESGFEWSVRLRGGPR